MTEQCLCAAMQMPDGYIIRGHRHDDCIQTAGKLRNTYDTREPRYDRQDFTNATQGFLTSENRFVGRREAAAIQSAANIPSVLGGGFPSMLFSEDLY